MNEPVTPSMDDKATPSPPVRTTEQYEADCRAGIQRITKADAVRRAISACEAAAIETGKGTEP